MNFDKCRKSNLPLCVTNCNYSNVTTSKHKKYDTGPYIGTNQIEINKGPLNRQILNIGII